jgi:hypothetical protein
MQKTEIDELDGLLNSLDYHIDECSHDNNCGGRFPDVDACTVSELVVKSRKLIAYVRRLEKVRDAALKVREICDEEWGELNCSVYHIEEDDYMAYWCRDLIDEALKEASDSEVGVKDETR